MAGSVDHWGQKMQITLHRPGPKKGRAGYITIILTPEESERLGEPPHARIERISEKLFALIPEEKSSAKTSAFRRYGLTGKGAGRVTLGLHKLGLQNSVIPLVGQKEVRSSFSTVSTGHKSKTPEIDFEFPCAVDVGDPDAEAPMESCAPQGIRDFWAHTAEIKPADNRREPAPGMPEGIVYNVSDPIFDDVAKLRLLMAEINDVASRKEITIFKRENQFRASIVSKITV
jgi:hypothetical protein